MITISHARRRGFTLIELLVVIAIIGLLATIAVVALGSARAKARDAKRVGDIKALQSAMELYYNDHQQYPHAPASASIVTLGTGIECGGAICTCLDGNGFGATCSTQPIYVGQLPTSPTANGGQYVYSPKQVNLDGSQGNPCGATDTCGSYNISFTLESPVQSLGSGTSCILSPSGITCSAS